MAVYADLKRKTLEKFVARLVASFPWRPAATIPASAGAGSEIV
jgi:hypothetical protein